MAEFCKQCSEDNFGKDLRDFAGYGRLEPGNGWMVLCEGCGSTFVDEWGKCIWTECPKHGGRKKMLVIYHAHCSDGFGAAYAAWKRFGSHDKLDMEFYPASYGTLPPDVRGKQVLILDFSYPRDTLVRMHEDAEKLLVIDHHKTAAEDLQGLDFTIFDMEHSGAVLTWMHLFPGEEVPKILQYVEDRDLWRFALPDSEAVNTEISILPHHFWTWDAHVVNPTNGYVMLRLKRSIVEAMASQAIMKEIDGYEVPVVNASVFFSEVADHLCMIYPAAKFAAYYYDQADGKRKWGLRSRHGFDVSAVARKFGGGGHPAAAGYVEDL